MATAGFYVNVLSFAVFQHRVLLSKPMTHPFSFLKNQALEKKMITGIIRHPAQFHAPRR